MKLTKMQLNALAEEIVTEISKAYREQKDEEKQRVESLPEYINTMDRIKQINSELVNLLGDPRFAKEHISPQNASQTLHNKYRRDDLIRVPSTTEVVNKLILETIEGTNIKEVINKIKNLYLPNNESED